MILSRLLKETLSTVVVTEDVGEALQEQLSISHVVREVLVMSGYMIDASRGGFTSGIMKLTKTVKGTPFQSAILRCLMFCPNKSLALHLVMHSSKFIFVQRS